jgi:AcrR family transcriptional regulator
MSSSALAPDPLPTPERLLDAAERVVVRDGAARLTMDAVVQEAGISKGGLLYHFPSKEALLAAMVSRHCGAWQQRLDEHVGQRGRSAAGLLQALLDAHLDEGACAPREVGAALLAAAAANPDLLAEPRRRRAQFAEELAGQRGDEGLALVLMAAVDGLALADLLRLSILTPAQHDQLVGKLRELAATCGAKP